MSFGGASGGEGLPQFKKFVSQNEIDEQKQKRQAEWERVRKPEDPEEAPEEEYDPRSLFDRLQEQKDKKQDEYEAQFKLSNQVRGIDEDEAQFLNMVSSKQEELEQKREMEDSVVLSEYHNALITKAVDSKPLEKKAAKQIIPLAKSKKSQLELLAGAVKRKSTDSTNTEAGSKKVKTDSEQTASGSSTAKFSAPTSRNDTAKVIGVLPGLGHYSDSSDSDSSSDSDCNTDLFKKKIVVHC